MLTDRSLPNASSQNFCFFAKFLPNPSREFSVGYMYLSVLGEKIERYIAILFYVNFNM